MTAVRDTDFTPSNIVTFYVAYPLFTILGVGAYFYAATRLPFFAKGYSLTLPYFGGRHIHDDPQCGLQRMGPHFLVDG